MEHQDTKQCMVEVLTCCGTIDKEYFDALSQFQVGPSTITDVLKEANVTCEIRIDQLLSKDSLDMTDADRALVAQRVAASDAQRILITHGTDTMQQTALAIVQADPKTIVLTGSMSPARFRSSDAIFNIGFAFAAVQLLPPGVYLAMNGRVFTPDNCHKNRSAQRFEAG